MTEQAHRAEASAARTARPSDLPFCMCGWHRALHRGPNESREGYLAKNGQWQAGCDGFTPQTRYEIVAQHGIAARNADEARSMIEGVVRHYLGGNTKFADKAWERLSFLLDVQEAA